MGSDIQIYSNMGQKVIHALLLSYEVRVRHRDGGELTFWEQKTLILFL